MHPAIIIVAILALGAFESKGAGADDQQLDAGYMAQDLLSWGYAGVEKLNEAEIETVWQFAKLERSGQFDEANKLLKQVQAIARKYGLVL